MSLRSACLATVLVPAIAAAQGISYDGGLSIATGEYIFNTPTTSWVLSTGLSARAGRFTLRAGVPLYMQNSTLVTGSGAGMIPSGGPSSGMVRDSGSGGGGGGGMMSASRRRLPAPASAATEYELAVGDPIVHLAWHVLDAATALTAGLAAKVPLTDTTSYGTGAWDVGATLSVTRTLGTASFLGVDVGYWHLGDLPELDFRDPLLATLSGGTRLGTGWAGSLYVSAATAALRGYDPPVAAGITLARLSAPAAWQISGALGLTDTAPELALSINWRVALRGSR